MIDGLRVVRGNAADLNVPPLDTEEFLYLARRLGYGPKTEKLSEDLNNQAQRVVEITGQLETIQSQAQPKG